MRSTRKEVNKLWCFFCFLSWGCLKFFVFYNVKSHSGKKCGLPVVGYNDKHDKEMTNK